MSPSGHRHAQITKNDHGPLVNVAAWTLLVTAILFTTFRIISNVVLRGRFGKDDWAVIAATAIAIAQTIATSMSVSNGLGQRQETLSPSMLVEYQKVKQ